MPRIHRGENKLLSIRAFVTLFYIRCKGTVWQNGQQNNIYFHCTLTF